MDWTTTLDLGSASSSSSDLLEKGTRSVCEDWKWANSYILAAIWTASQLLPTFIWVRVLILDTINVGKMTAFLFFFGPISSLPCMAPFLNETAGCSVCVCL
jgi:hypothetical protein